MGLGIWNILEIEATTDVSAIRKAYAAKLKTCRPEEDPVNFQKLREAYETALTLAKAKARPDNVFTISYARPPEEVSEDLPLQPAREDPTQIFSLMEELYSDFFRRIEIDNWKSILESDLFWDIGLRARIKSMILHFFAEHPALPKAVWILMDKEFGWSECLNITAALNIYDYSVLRKELDTRWDLDYTCFRKFASLRDTEPSDSSSDSDGSSGKGTDYAALFAEYVEIRRSFRDALMNGAESEISEKYETAFCLFSGDPDLHRFYYEYKKAFGELVTFGLLFEIPKKTIEKLRELYPDNPEYEAAEADVCLLNNDYKTAARLYARLVKRLPDHLDVAFHYGIAVGNLGRHRQSHGIFEKIKKDFPKVEDRLSNKKSYIKDPVAVLNQISKNRHVYMQLKKIESY